MMYLITFLIKKTPVNSIDKSSSISRAINFIKHNAANNPSLKDITDAAYCSSRTLQRAFKGALNQTPMQYLKTQKLINANNALRSAGLDETVTQIALNCGFTHLGKFAVDYKWLFGESPSQTLKNNRDNTYKPTL